MAHVSFLPLTELNHSLPLRLRSEVSSILHSTMLISVSSMHLVDFNSVLAPLNDSADT